MNKSIKASLLSALLFPGAGHIFLKKYLLGTVLSASAIAALYVLIANAVVIAQQIVEKIQNGEIGLDAAAITAVMEKQPPGAESLLIDIATLVLIVSWLIAVVDSYRLGKIQDNDAANKET